MDRIFRDTFRHAAPGVHGSPDSEELRDLGMAPGALLDFSANLNPCGASPRVAEALTQVAVSHYPDRHCTGLRKAIAEHHGVSSDNVLPGNGSSELIHLLAHATLVPGETALIAGPTFGEYRRAASLAGAEVVDVRAEPPEFVPSLNALRATAAQLCPRLLFLCNPNNPTGVYLAPEDVRVVRDAALCAGGLLVLDEAYVDFVAGGWDAVREIGLHGVVILRSLTKLHGLAGLRLGYLLADTGTVKALASGQPPWSVNAMAQAAGIAALQDQEHLERSRALLLNERKILQVGVSTAGYRALLSTTSFFLADVDHAAGFRRRLLRRGILVRDCTSFGMAEHVRISARMPEENAHLLAAIHACG